MSQQRSSSNYITSKSRFYDEIADDYEKEIVYESAFYYEHYKAIADFLARYLVKNNSRILKILDIGCGSGFWSNILREMGYEVVGIDISSRSVEKASSKGLAVMVGDAENISIREESFDAAIALASVINHLDHLDKFFRDVNLVLKRGGYLIFDFDSSWSIDNLYEALIYRNHNSREIIKSFISFRALRKGYKIYWDLGRIYINVYSLFEIFSLLKRNGFSIRYYEPIHMFSSIIPVRVQEETKNQKIRRIIDILHRLDDKTKKILRFFVTPFTVSYIVLAQKIT